MFGGLPNLPLASGVPPRQNARLAHFKGVKLNRLSWRLPLAWYDKWEARSRNEIRRRLEHLGKNRPENPAIHRCDDLRTGRRCRAADRKLRNRSAIAARSR